MREESLVYGKSQVIGRGHVSGSENERQGLEYISDIPSLVLMLPVLTPLSLMRIVPSLTCLSLHRSSLTMRASMLSPVWLCLVGALMLLTLILCLPVSCFRNPVSSELVWMRGV